MVFIMLKLPFKIKLCSIDFHKTHFDGEIEFHEKRFPLNIQPIVDKRIIKTPFDVIGVKNQNVLVRISGKNGIYAEDHLKMDGKSSSLEIHSFPICDEISNRYNVLDTIEIFFK